MEVLTLIPKEKKYEGNIINNIYLSLAGVSWFKKKNWMDQGDPY